ncbi:hypothetical protein HK405_007070, partial [Cladochytrium tenue]
MTTSVSSTSTTRSASASSASASSSTSSWSSSLSSSAGASQAAAAADSASGTSLSASPTATDAPPPTSDINLGVAVGAGIGGAAAFVAVVAVLCWFFLRRRRKPGEAGVASAARVGGNVGPSERLPAAPDGQVVFQPAHARRPSAAQQSGGGIQLISGYRDADLAGQAIMSDPALAGAGTIGSSGRNLQRRLSTSSIMTTGSLAAGFAEAERSFGTGGGPDLSQFLLSLETYRWTFTRGGSSGPPLWFVATDRPASVASLATLTLDPATGLATLISSSSPTSPVRDQVYRALLWRDVALQVYLAGGPRTPRRLPPSAAYPASAAGAGGRDAWEALLEVLPRAVEALAAQEERWAADGGRFSPVPDAAHSVVQEFCGVVATLCKTAAAIPVRIGYEPRASNEVALSRHDVVSLWHVVDDYYGYGLNINSGVIGFVNLNHLDARKLASATSPPPLPPALPTFFGLPGRAPSATAIRQGSPAAQHYESSGGGGGGNSSIRYPLSHSPQSAAHSTALGTGSAISSSGPAYTASPPPIATGYQLPPISSGDFPMAVASATYPSTGAFVPQVQSQQFVLQQHQQFAPQQPQQFYEHQQQQQQIQNQMLQFQQQPPQQLPMGPVTGASRQMLLNMIDQSTVGSHMQYTTDGDFASENGEFNG